MKMTDKDYLTVILELEKNMSNNMSIAMNEASNEYLYEDYFDMFTGCKDMARDIYEYMASMGWYTVEEEQQDKINKKIGEFNNYLDQLENNN